MIRSYRHKGLKELFEDGGTAEINAKYHGRLRRQLDTINAATDLRQLDLPGWALHALRGRMAGRHAVRVGGPWRLTFEFRDGDAYRLDFEQYH
jgi:proteic killer suppression protein